jgi:hypothetical protein
MCLLLAPVFQGFFFVVAIYSMNEANKAAVHAVKQSILLRCLWVDSTLAMCSIPTPVALEGGMHKIPTLGDF